MKTLDQILKYETQCLDQRDLKRLVSFVPLYRWSDLGIRMEFVDPKVTENFVPIELTEENVIAQLRQDVAFGFEKALNRRGLSADAMNGVVSMWNWVLENELEVFNSPENYRWYGLPLLKATAILYGFENPIGNDKGSEDKYGDPW